MTDDNKKNIRCHYDVLSIPLNADDASIKKAHRTLARKYHPDKSKGNEEEFRLVQQAYECLSDARERAWYDSHRDAILKGWSVSNDQSTEMLFNIVPYQHPSCYNGYSSREEGSFYAVYQRVFEQIAKEEHALNLINDFGNEDTEWTPVKQFYQMWQGFSSSLEYTWVDVHDETEAPNRRIRRAMAEENKRARRVARKERNQDVIALVNFVKRRDPRVKAYLERVQEESRKKQREQKKEAERKRVQTLEQREEWKKQAALDMQAMEKEDLEAGRVRLADHDDDYEYNTKKGRRKKNKKRGNKAQNVESSKDVNQESSLQGEEHDAIDHADESIHSHDKDNVDEHQETDEAHFVGQDELQSSEEEEEEVPDIWRCVVCRKDFKSEGQMENHMKSKKHKEAHRKYLKKQEGEVVLQNMMEDILL